MAISDFDQVALVPIVTLPDAHVRRIIIIVFDEYISVVIALHVLRNIAIPKSG